MNRLLNKLIPLTTAAFLAGAIATPAARAFTIDTFDNQTTELFLVGSGTTSETDTGVTGAVGGARNVTLTESNGAFAVLGINDSNVFGFNATGSLYLTSTTNGDTTGSILYDANGSGLGGVDLTESGFNDRFRLAVITGNNLRSNNSGVDGSALTTVTLLLMDDQVTPETATATVNFPTDSFTGAFDIAFSLFETDNPNIDLSSIDSIQISINIPESAPSQIEIDSFTATVPFNFQSTAGLVLVGAFFGGSYYLKKKKKKQAAKQIKNSQLAVAK
jgi:hypothetical protein